MELYQLKAATAIPGSDKFIQKMGYILRTQGGKTLVIDGGNIDGDAWELLAWLQKLTGAERPRVDYWFFTHAHADHIGSFVTLMEEDKVEVGRMVYHFAPFDFLAKAEPSEAWILPRFADAVAAHPEIPRVTVQVGDCFTIDDVKITNLLVYDPRITANAFNNTGVVYRLEAHGQSLLFLGDLGVESGYRLLGMYGDALKSDMVQMAHHGQNGVDFPVYRAIAPRACLWNAPDWLWDNDDGKGYNQGPWRTVEVRGWMEQLGVREHYIIKDGTLRIPFGA